ncbi:hypothetical protein [Paraglaciecola hydrolytica]|uniref:Uncharacterized protein n=1 Tax=Paraglaciecola hydrolytica TaxID=1799789 RepID=A0A148KKW3_9ALTE|nr:hypothetical protein [Paraglaciecola hydrolytica]KXI26920.1 hypothetical protein AX660_02680 [Paraglaciecola hydrolytica]
MILHRITQHVKDQNWFAVALDFVIVVVGILIAFQITNWGDTKAERKRETQILQQIATDLLSDLDDYSSSIEGTLTKIATATYLVEQARKTAPLHLTDGVEIGNMTYQDYIDSHIQLRKKSFVERVEELSNEFWSFSILVANAQPSTTAFDSIVSAGELGILRDKTLVQNLQEYRHITAALQKAQDVTLRPARNNAIEIGQQYGLSVFGGVEKETLLKLVSTSPELAATIQNQLGWAKGHFVMISAAQKNAKALLEKINETLGSPPNQEANR